LGQIWTKTNVGSVNQ